MKAEEEIVHNELKVGKMKFLDNEKKIPKGTWSKE